MLEWQYYPKSDRIPSHLADVVEIFETHFSLIDSRTNKLGSNQVLAVIRDDLSRIGFAVEKGRTAVDKIKIAVLFGRNGKPEKYFETDAYNKDTKTIMEVEAGRALTNNQFLKDMFQACVMHDADYLIIAVRRLYLENPDFNRIVAFMDTLYASSRLKLPLKGILVIGY